MEAGEEKVKKRFIIAGLIVLVALIYIGYTAFQHSATYYLTVSELREKGTSVNGERVRVSGMLTNVTPDYSIQSRVQFVLSESGDDLAVVYQGVLPDAFRVGNEIMVEGYLDAAGVFQGKTIITKCPSKYEPAKQ